MTLSPVDALVASWLLQSALAAVFTIALWGMSRSFGQKAIRALALGWNLYVLLVTVTLVEAWLLRTNTESRTITFVAGVLELAGVLASCAFWSPVAGLLVNDRRPTLPVPRVALSAATALLILPILSLVSGRIIHVPGSGPLWFLYPVPYLALATDAWLASSRSATNRAVLRGLALGYVLFALRILLAKSIMTGHTVADASGQRLLSIATIQVLQMVAFGVISLLVGLALERTAIIALAARSRAAELAAFKTERLESLGRMTAGIAHDFNNVLTAMVGSAGLARLVPGRPPAVDQELDVMDDAIARARQLVRQLLDFARQRPTTPSRFSVNELIRQDAALLRHAVGTGTRLSLDPSATRSEVLMDPAQLTQVVLNLVTNARDASAPDGPITVCTRTEMLATPRPLPDGEIGPGAYLVISVDDAGQGIGPDVIPHIFEPFYTTKGGSRGTGLGLATAYRVIADAGGDIVVESAVGVGTRIDVYLPLASETAPPGRIDPRQAPADRP